MMAGAKPNKETKKAIEDDEYIEEEFDEVIESDNGSFDSDTSEKQRRFEQMRKASQAQSQILVSKNVATSARNPRNTRPISATFSLEATKLGSKQPPQSQRDNINSRNQYDSSGY